MSNSKPMHNGISNDDGVIAINWALKTFVDRVRDGDELPEHLLEFVADGVERYLKGSKAWSGKRDREVDNASKYGLVLALVQRGVKRCDIAAHLGISENRVSEMIHEKVPVKHRAFNQREHHKEIWLLMFQGKSTIDMLIALEEEFRKSEN